MKHSKISIENLFERWARGLYNHPWKTLLVLLLITGGLLVQMRHMTFDTSSEALLHDNDPYRIEYDRFRQVFGQDRNIILGITTPDIFTQDFLIKLKTLHREIESSVPYLKKVNSLLTARNVTGKDNSLHVGELLIESWPKTPGEMTLLRRKVMNNPFYLNHLVSEDGSMAAIVIETRAVIVDTPISEAEILAGFSDDPDLVQASENSSSHFISAAEIREIVDVIEQIIPRYQADNFDIGFTGSPVVVDVFNRAVAVDMMRCSLFAIAVIALLMGLLFRRLSGICIPLIVVVASVISTLGLMALLGVDIKIMTAILPVFILCVGVADSVHILTAFFLAYRDDTSKEDAIARAMKHSALAVLLTSLTTAAGLLSFAFADISAIGEMGIFSAIGVVIALTYTFCMLPPLMALFPLKPGTGEKQQVLMMDRLLTCFADFSADHAKKIVIGCIVLLVFSMAYLPGLKYVDHMLNYFSDDMKVKHDIVQIDKGLSGIITFEAVIDTGKENGLHNPALLNRIEDVTHHLQNDPASRNTPHFGVHKIFSINDIIKEMNRALHDDDPAFYSIPQDPQLIAQEFLLFENSGSDELEPIVDTPFSKTRVSIKVPWLDSLGLYRLSDRIRAVFDEPFSDLARVSFTGMSVILARTLPATLSSMKESYLLAAVIISILMVFLAGNMKTGLLAMFPNLLPILAIMGGLSMLKIPLDMTSLMIDSIAIGLVVDDTMHFIYHFHRHLDQTGDAREAVRRTLLGTGRALLVTTLVLTGGFLTLTMAALPSLFRFGMLLAIILVLALLIDFILAPALMILTISRAKYCPEGETIPIHNHEKKYNRHTSHINPGLSDAPGHKPSIKGEKRHAV